MKRNHKNIKYSRKNGKSVIRKSSGPVVLKVYKYELWRCESIDISLMAYIEISVSSSQSCNNGNN
jgi:hypothetical protein